MDSTYSSTALGGIGMVGAECDLHLIARVCFLKIAQVGGECAEEDIIKFLYDQSQGGGYLERKVSSSVVFSTGEGRKDRGKPVIASVRRDWKVFLHLDLENNGGGTVTTLFFNPLGERQAWTHNPIPHSAAKTVIGFGQYSELSGGCAYVERETHYAHGLIWDPGAEVAANVCHYPDGRVKSRRRYQGGRMMGRGDQVPAHESYWPDGVLQAEEYGSVNSGRYRDPSAGPSYAEYHPNGKLALEVFSVKEDDGRVVIRGGGVWDSNGRTRTPDAQESAMLSDTGLALARYDSTDEFFESRRVDRAVAEAIAEGGKPVPAKLVLPHPPGVKRVPALGPRGVAKGRTGR